jgi:hypothetical protein
MYVNRPTFFYLNTLFLAPQINNRYNLKSLFSFLLLFALYSPAFSQLEKVESDLNYLASDALKGRKNGSPELLEAAKWIANEFKNIGLESPSFTNDYLQEVTLIEAENKYRSLLLNGMSINEDKFFVLGQKAKFQINSERAIEVFVVEEQDNIMRVLNEIQNVTGSYAVLIHPAHRARYNKIKMHFTKPKKELENEEANFSLWVLTNEKNIHSIDLSVVNALNKSVIYNVIGELPTTLSENRNWIYSAHYDHLGIINEAGSDSIANGANDDASGVVAMLELARRFTNGEAPDKGLYFVAFAGEEIGLFGSRKLVSTLDLNTIEAMINIEMIGIPNNDLGPQSAFISGYDLSYLPTDIAKNSSSETFMFFPDPYIRLHLFRRSDNYSFAKFGIPAHSVSTYSEDDYTYHTVDDEIENLDIEHIMEVINAIYLSSYPLLQLDYNPGIIDFKTKTDR